MGRGMTFAALGDSAVVVTLGAATSEAGLRQVWRLAEALDQAQLPGITDVVAAYATVAVFYEATAFAGREQSVYESVCQQVAACAAAAGIGAPGLNRRVSHRVVVPVCYGGEFGPDLAEVAQHCGISEAEVIVRHAAAITGSRPLASPRDFPTSPGCRNPCGPRGDPRRAPRFRRGRWALGAPKRGSIRWIVRGAGS